MISREFLLAWFKREWQEYRLRMNFRDNPGWQQRIIYQRAKVRCVVSYLRRKDLL